MGIKTKIFTILAAAFPKEFVIVILATLPIFELRLTVPLGKLYFKLPLPEVYFLSLLGNMLPVLPLLLFFKYFFHRLEHIKFLGKFFRWWFKKVEQRSKIVERWGFWGLVFFVAIPLPVTGAWTGTVAATLCELKIKKSFLAILIGVSLAGLIMSTLTIAADQIMRQWLNFI